MGTRLMTGERAAALAPFVPGLPLLGNALNLRYDPLAYFTRLYHEYGAIFRLNILNREITVLAGIEANQLLAQDSTVLFGSDELFGGFAKELEAELFLVAMDGKPHLHQRKQMKQGYSRSQAVPHIDYMIDVVNRFADTLKVGDTFAVFPSMQRLVTDQLGMIMANQPPGDYFDDLRLFLNYSLNVNVLRLWHPLMLRAPAYRRAKARVLELGRRVIADHRANPPVDRPRDLIDDLIEARDDEGKPFSEATLIAATIGPYLAGIDTVASSISFFVYTLLKHPPVAAAAAAEVETAFANGNPGMDDFRQMTTLHNAAVETLRMYPVAPFTPRTTTADFTFNGYHIPAGTEVFFAQTVTHYLPEFYPEPERFNPDRFSGNSRGKPGAFGAYTLGAHLCLGAGLAETQIAVLMTALLKRVRLEFTSPDYTLKIHATPLPNPGRDFRVRVVEKR